MKQTGFNIIKPNESGDESRLERLLNAIRENMRDVKLSEKNEPTEITVKIIYPTAIVSHSFAVSEGGERQ